MGINSNRLESVYALICVLLPVFSIYSSPIPSFDFGTVVVVFFFFICLINNASFRLEPLLWVLIVFTFLDTIPAIIGLTHAYSPVLSVLLRTLRFVILLIVLLGFGYTSFYSSSKYIGYVRVVSLLAAGYVYLQSAFFRFFGYKLRNVFGPIKGGGEFSSSLGEYEFVYRPPSFFLEPSHVCYFLIPFLCYVLFSKKSIEKRDLIEAVFVTGGILLTTSGQGLIIAALCWFIWILRQLKSIKLHYLILVIFSLIILFKTVDVSYTINRVLSTDDYNAMEARSGGYRLVSEMPFAQLVFGNGFGNYPEDTFFTSYADILFCTGLVGLVCVLLFFLSLFIRGTVFQRVFIVIILTIMISGGIYTASFLCFYLPLLLEKERN